MLDLNNPNASLGKKNLAYNEDIFIQTLKGIIETTYHFPYGY